MSNQGPGWPEDPYAGQQPPPGGPPGYGQPPQGFPPPGQPPAQGYPAPDPYAQPADPYAQPAQGYGYEGQPFAPQNWGDYGHGVGQAGIPTWVKITAYIVSGLKFIPLVLLLVFALFAGSILDDIDSTFGSDTDSIQAVLIVVALIFLLIGGGLLLGQIMGAAKDNRTLLIVMAAILVALDVLSLLSGLFGEGTDVGGIILVFAIGAAQVAILVGAIQASDS